ncbi:MAG TPA: mannose-6-phosphate isomerase, class I [Rectinemataceae bacterium]
MPHLTMPRKKIHKLTNPVRHYAWGSYDGFSLYAGVEQDKDKPSAELWLGAHPDAPSLADLGGGRTQALNRYIESNRNRVLGEQIAGEYGFLPFLFKVLSASMPLSIQVHPSKAKAEAGYERESRAGILPQAPERDYKDRNHKPELAVALSDFEALCGFRDAQEIRDLLGDELAAFFGFSSRDGEASLRILIAKALGLKEKDKLLLERMAVDRGRKLAENAQGPSKTAGQTLLACYAHYPHDPGALSPLFLQVHKLKPGQGIYVPAGVMHAYLSGTILEIMASSDNVIRGGLTQKHMDIPELLEILDFGAGPAIVEARAENGGESLVWDSPAREFRLSARMLRNGHPQILQTRGPEILLCTRGSVTVQEIPRQVGASEAHESSSLVMERGSSIFVSADCTSYKLEGEGSVYRATVGGVDSR